MKITKKIIFISILVTVLLIFIFYLYLKKDSGKDTYNHPKYKGIVLFDIDGTLSTGLQNEKVVQYFIDRKYAVGISTAGAMYHPNNLLEFAWMPMNLYNWMEQHNFNTFNNVGSGILCGQYNPEAFNNSNERNDLDLYNMLGWRKGLTLAKTAELYDITDPKKMILLDNDPSYIKGLSLYNSNFNVICAGKPCSDNHMSMYTISPLVDYDH
jgi:hypothetical protein